MGAEVRVTLEPTLAARYAAWALDGLSREYPCKLAHALNDEGDVAAPRRLNPAFWGCFDWHSAVHSVWSLTRLLRGGLSQPLAAQAEAAIDARLTADHVAAEVRYLTAPGRAGFELPYGGSWLLLLALELHEWDDPRSARWGAELRPLTSVFEVRLVDWADRLPFPIRTGTHDQSAFGMSLALDYYDGVGGGEEAGARLREAARRLYGRDRDGPLHLEPSAHDFLSPCLAEADLMRRVLDPQAFSTFLRTWLPRFSDPSVPFSCEPLLPVSCPDPTDGRLAHLEALNLSRAWMLRGIAGGLPTADARVASLRGLADDHDSFAQAELAGAHYAGSHWQGSFAVYGATERWR